MCADSVAPILAYGTVVIHAMTDNGPMSLTLGDAAFVPSFHTSLVSMYKANQAGIHHNTKKGCLETVDDRFLCHVQQVHRMNVIEYNPIDTHTAALDESNASAYAVQTSTQDPHSTADAERWHERLAHANTAAIDHLTVTADGVSLPPCTHKAISANCETCRLAKAKCQISRRSIPRADRLFEKLYFDFFSMKPMAYNGDRCCLLIVCSTTRWQSIKTMPDKDQYRIINAFREVVARAKNALNISVKTFFSDRDVSLGLDYTLFAQKYGIEILHSAHYVDSQHGNPERAGGVTIAQARSMMIKARLPQVLWPLAMQAAIYIGNRTPTWTTVDGVNIWTTPFERTFAKKLNLANLRVFGC